MAWVRGEPDAVEVASPVRRADQRNPPAETLAGRHGPTLLGHRNPRRVRKDLWREMRKLPSPTIARKFAGARWVLLKNSVILSKHQGLALLAIKQRGGALWRACRDEGVRTGDRCW